MKKNKKKISDEIQELIKSYKKLELTMSSTETKTIKIPFV